MGDVWYDKSVLQFQIKREEKKKKKNWRKLGSAVQRMSFNGMSQFKKAARTKLGETLDQIRASRDKRDVRFS